jgi:hypothetical protein
MFRNRTRLQLFSAHEARVNSSLTRLAYMGNQNARIVWIARGPKPRVFAFWECGVSSS